MDGPKANVEAYLSYYIPKTCKHTLMRKKKRALCIFSSRNITVELSHLSIVCGIYSKSVQEEKQGATWHFAVMLEDSGKIQKCTESRREEWHEDLFLLLNTHNTETTIHHTNWPGHRPTYTVSRRSDKTK